MIKKIILNILVINIGYIALSQNELLYINNNSVFIYNIDNDSSYLIYEPDIKNAHGYEYIGKIEKQSDKIITIELFRDDNNNNEYLIRKKVFTDISKKSITNIVNDSCSRLFLGKEYIGNIPLFTLYRTEKFCYLLVDSLIQRSRTVNNVQFLTDKGNIYRKNEKGVVSIYFKHKKGENPKFRFLECGYDYIDIDNNANKIVICDLSYKKNVTKVFEININTLEKTGLFEIPKSKIHALRYSEDGNYVYFMNSSSIDNQFIGNFIFDIKNKQLRKLGTGYYVMWL